MKPSIIKHAQDELFDFECIEHWINIDDVYVGANAQVCFKNGKMSSTDVRDIKENCRGYYIELCRQVLARINVHDPVLKSLEIIDPSDLGPSICPLLISFPNMGLDDISFEDIDMEWRSVIVQELVPTNLDLETFWGKVFELTNGLNEPMYPLLKIFVGSLLALPHSSACAERIFSKVSLIKSKIRNKLEMPTVNAIMLAVGMVDNAGAHEWTPSKMLIDKYHKR